MQVEATSERCFGGISVVIPALNEEASIAPLVEALIIELPEAEILVVDDGSNDRTAERASEAGARVVQHPYRKGNGAAVKSGARAANGAIFVFMDADGQHRASDVKTLLKRLDDGFDMVVAARSRSAQASFVRRVGNGLYNRIAGWIVNRPIPDLTSGFRAVRAEQFKEFLPLFPNGFSYPTTVTMAFFRAGYSVDFIPIDVQPRVGRSHLNIWRDGGRFALIIFRIGALYSPLKLFTPFAGFVGLLGVLNYAYTYFTFGTFTNMSALMFVTAVLIFLMGLVSEQIVMLLYKRD